MNIKQHIIIACLVACMAGNLAVFDSLGAREIGYSISEDGITWPLETRLTVQTGGNQWVGDGDHNMRTPCALFAKRMERSP